jgi:AcrR family transcriptional regulator
MTRTVKEYDERYAEFLAIAQELFYRQGYEQTSVQEIITALGVAKGTFYHYFASKADLLSALVEHLYRQTVATLEPMVADESRSAVDKFNALFVQIGVWEADNRELLIDALHMLYQDKNLRLRSRMMAQSNAVIAPLLARIVRQGVAEGAFAVASPDDAAEIVLAIGMACFDMMSTLILMGPGSTEAAHTMKRKLSAYERSIERVLGAAADSLRLIDSETLQVWLTYVETGGTQ